jgi:hypothetical protein
MTPPGVDPARMEDQVRNQLLRAIRDVTAEKMATGQLQFRNLGEGNMAAVIPEIIGRSQLAQSGVQIGNLTMRFNIDVDPEPQHQVDVKMNVGGFNINASSHGGLDTAGLQGQLKDKAKSQIIWWGIGCGILLLVGLFIAGLGLYIWRAAGTSGSSSTSSTSGSTGTAAKWNGNSPFTCGGNDNFVISGVTASAGITARGNCKLTITGVDITAPTGIEAGGNAVITITGGSITSSTFAIHATGNAVVTITGTKVSGKTQAVGVNAKINGV